MYRVDVTVDNKYVTLAFIGQYGRGVSSLPGIPPDRACYFMYRVAVTVDTKHVTLAFIGQYGRGVSSLTGIPPDRARYFMYRVDRNDRII